MGSVTVDSQKQPSQFQETVLSSQHLFSKAYWLKRLSCLKAQIIVMWKITICSQIPVPQQIYYTNMLNILKGMKLP